MKNIHKHFLVGSVAVCLIAPISSYAESGTMEAVGSFLANYSKSEFW